MSSSVSGHPRRAAFPAPVVEEGFWYVLGVAREVAPAPGAPAAAQRLAGMRAAAGLSDGQFRGIVEVIAAARAWAREDEARPTISAGEYEATRRRIVARWGVASAKGTLLWPPTSQTVAARLGGGHWNDALRRMGLRTSALGRVRGGAKFSEHDVLSALRRYVRDADARCEPVSFAGYQAWADARRGVEAAVPAASTIRRRYRTWSAALRALE